MRRLIYLGAAVIAVALFAMPASASFGSSGRITASPEFEAGVQQRRCIRPAYREAARADSQGRPAQAPGQDPRRVRRRRSWPNGQFVELAPKARTRSGQCSANLDTNNPPHLGAAGTAAQPDPEPERAEDNTTIWTPDFNTPTIENMLFSRRRGCLDAQLLHRAVLEPVHGQRRRRPTGAVSYNEARYGTNACGGIVCSTVWRFVNDSVDAWYSRTVAAGKTTAQIKRTWRSSTSGTATITTATATSTSPTATSTTSSRFMPGKARRPAAAPRARRHLEPPLVRYFRRTADGPDRTLGGVRVGNSNYWIGDYTIEPENGGVGVFSHEFGHDLGLPDLYDTSATPVARRTRPASGPSTRVARTAAPASPRKASARSRSHMSALERSSSAGRTTSWSAQAGPRRQAGAGGVQHQAGAAAGRAPAEQELNTIIGTPFAGSYFYHSGAGDDLDNKMTRPISLGAGPIGLSSRHGIRSRLWDYADVEVSTEADYVHVDPHVGLDDDNENGQNFGNGITGTSGSPKVCDALGIPSWVNVTADLSPYANSTIQLRFRYWTDGAVVGTGFSADDIAITGQSHRRRRNRPGLGGMPVSRAPQAQPPSFVQQRLRCRVPQYAGFDDSLRTGPYNFGFLGHPSCRTGSSTSRIRTVCSSGTTTRRSATTTWATIVPRADAADWCSRSMLTRIC